MESQSPIYKKFFFSIIILIVISGAGYYFLKYNRPQPLPSAKMIVPLSVLEAKSKITLPAIIKSSPADQASLPIKLDFLGEIESLTVSTTTFEGGKTGYEVRFVENKPVDIQRYYQGLVVEQSFKFVNGFYSKIAGLITLENDKYLVMVKESSLSDTKTSIIMTLVSK